MISVKYVLILSSFVIVLPTVVLKICGITLYSELACVSV